MIHLTAESGDVEDTVVGEQHEEEEHESDQVH